MQEDEFHLCTETGDRMKPDGLLSTAQALRYWELRQQALSHNLANADTHGFKAERVFARLVDEKLVEPEQMTDLTAGSLTETGSPLDLAIQGPGFFVVDTAAGERLTRGGAIEVDETGQLVIAQGHALLGEWGPITVPEGRIEIDATGTVRVEGREIERLRIETAPTATRMDREAAGLFVPGEERTVLEPIDRRVRQGFLEESNVSTIESMVEMIDVQRSFAAVQNGVRVIDGVLETIANRIGRAD